MILERSKGSGDHSDGGHETFRNSGSSLGNLKGGCGDIEIHVLGSARSVNLGESIWHGNRVR